MSSQEVSTPHTGVTGQFEAVNLVTNAPETSQDQLLAIRNRLTQEMDAVNARLRGRNITPEYAAKILGPDIFFGADALEKTRGIKIPKEILDQIPFNLTEQEARNAFRLKTPISLQIKSFSYEKGHHSIMLDLNEQHVASKLEYRQTTPNIVPGTLGKDFLERTDLQIRYLREEFYKGHPLPPTYEKAIQEFNQKRPTIESFAQENFSNRNMQDESVKMAKDLKIVQLLRPTIESIIQDVAYMNSVGKFMSIRPGAYDIYTDTSNYNLYPYGNGIRTMSLSDDHGNVQSMIGILGKERKVGAVLSRSLGVEIV